MVSWRISPKQKQSLEMGRSILFPWSLFFSFSLILNVKDCARTDKFTQTNAELGMLGQFNPQWLTRWKSGGNQPCYPGLPHWLCGHKSRRETQYNPQSFRPHYHPRKWHLVFVSCLLLPGSQSVIRKSGYCSFEDWEKTSVNSLEAFFAPWDFLVSESPV